MGCYLHANDVAICNCSQVLSHVEDLTLILWVARISCNVLCGNLSIAHLCELSQGLAYSWGIFKHRALGTRFGSLKHLDIHVFALLGFICSQIICSLTHCETLVSTELLHNLSEMVFCLIFIFCFL